MRGTRPKPTVLKRLEGNPGKRRLNDAEPQPPPFIDDGTPDILVPDPIATAEFRRLAPMLRQLRVLTSADVTALVALCLEWSRYLTATERIRTEGMLATAQSGFLMPHPYLGIASRSLASCLKLWSELGLTPSSRSRVRVEGPGPDGDAFSEFDRPASTEH